MKSLSEFSASLAEYLALTVQRKWQYGENDCCTFMADWLALNGVADPMADIRGTYSSRRQYLRISRAEGGFESACAERLTKIGLVPSLFPRRGDVMLVQAPYAKRHGKIQTMPTGAICVSDTMRAVVTVDLGIVVADNSRLPMIRAWSVCQ